MISFSDFKLSLFVAFKTIVKGSKSTSLLLVFILGLAFFNLLFIKGFLAGFSDGVLQSMIDSTTSHIIIMPQEEPIKKNFIVNEETIRKQVETIPGVLATSKHYLLSGSVAFDKEKNGILKYISTPIVGITGVDDKKVMNLHEHVVSGDFPDELKDDEVILGVNLAGGFDSVQTADLGGAKAGDKVHILYSNGIEKIYTVRGVFQVILGFASNDAFISNKEAERILQKANEASEIMVRVDLTKHPLTEYTEKITAMVPGLRIDPYTKRLSTIGILINSFDAIALIVSIVSIIVSAATIFVMVYINALSKQKQIGILKAIGIKESIIEWSYVVQALFYSVLGVLFGTLMLFYIALPYLKVHPIEMPFGDAYVVLTVKDYVLGFIYMIFSSIVAGYVPARMVSKRDILKVIWG